MSQSPDSSDTHPAARAPVAGPIATATRLVKRYGATTVLDSADVEIQTGTTGLLGANGAGKTTLIGLMLGLHQPDAGTIEVLGMSPRTAGPDIRMRIGYSPEHHLVPPEQTANDFVRHMAQMHGLPSDHATERASDALFLVGLGEERFRPLGTMSTGQRQRVKLAQAIAHAPDLIFLDEPTDGLDPVQRDAMLELIASLYERTGASVVLSSHLLDEVERACTRAVILAGGRVAESGTLSELRGEGRGVVVALDGTEEQVADLAAHLTTSDLTVERRGHQLTVSGELDADVLLDLIRDAIADRDLGIRRLAGHTVSLRDVFVGAGP